MEKRNSFYITTPIYYVTASPHLGSLYATLLADVLARWNKLQNKEVFFLTGTDEHGQKIAQAALQAGKNPKDFVDSFIPHYKKIWDLYDIQYDFFIRTTDEYHIQGAQSFIKTLIDKDQIYKSQYKGWYCTPCETFVTEKTDDNAVEQVPLCPTCGRGTHIVSEETYFFKLSEYADKLLKFYKENLDFITPKERLNEVLSFVESGLKDLSISRTTVAWGVPFPQDPDHTVYVWVEALCNYITAIGYGHAQSTEMFDTWWPADVQVLGKDIVRFHAVYWPALLMAAGLSLPKRLLVHGWIKVDKQKMSKSFGNAIDPIALQEQYGAQEIRYYLMRQIPVNQDADFSTQDVEARIEDDLANDLGNLLNRMSSLAEKYAIIDVVATGVWSDEALDVRYESWNMIEDFSRHIDDCMFHLALARLWKFIKRINIYFHAQEPWKKAKLDDNKRAFLEILSVTCHSLRIVAILLWPVMPKKMEELLASLGTPFDSTQSSMAHIGLDNWNKHFMLRKIPVLFERVATEHAEHEATKANVTQSMLDTHKKESSALSIQRKESPALSIQRKESPALGIQSKEFNSVRPEPVEGYEQNDVTITIDDVVKVEMCVGTIQECSAVANSDKLVQMTVSLGTKGTRTILAGIKQWYAPSDLVGKRGVFVINLKPRKMAGIFSHGMMLVAEAEDGMRHLVPVDASVPDGTRLQ